MIKATIGKLGFNMVRILPECDCVDLASLKSHYVFSDDHQAILCEYCADDYAGQNEVNFKEINPIS